MIASSPETQIEPWVEPQKLDELWAQGWRHFGPLFFRYQSVVRDGQLLHVQPMRVMIAHFKPSKSQRRVLRRNEDLCIQVKPTNLDQTRHQLFQKHKQRFTDHVPGVLEDFLGWHPSCVPCANVEIGLYESERLIAASYLDLGDKAVSSVYAIFDPEFSDRSLGICTMLHELAYAAKRGYVYYYPGYAYHEPSSYDYKKRFAASEWNDWQGNWRDLELVHANSSVGGGPPISL